MVGIPRIEQCLKSLKTIDTWILYLAASDANYYERYDIEAIIRNEIKERTERYCKSIPNGPLSW